ncbi:hypothetical protein QBC37DRAFT_72950 [Rhypophila decipiens]|uniref:Uncharacterized protein n=1 Tax=Rhypophila decipiens TaxID=261697 RepID=A0AAN7BDK5_9PEZI|nr:hypothetical protein QBC37DRAFT_72950 [Rhypophila decipiens]
MKAGNNRPLVFSCYFLFWLYSFSSKISFSHFPKSSIQSFMSPFQIHTYYTALYQTVKHEIMRKKRGKANKRTTLPSMCNKCPGISTMFHRRCIENEKMCKL